jgi:hypothetical protein
MQEHIYRPSKRKVFNQSFLIWLLVALQIIANCFVIPTFISMNQYWAIAFINIVLGFITVPSVYLFVNYYKNSINKEFIVTYNFLKMIDKKEKTAIEINIPEIQTIELHQNLYLYSALNLAPWSSHEYFCFIDKNGKKIIVTSYFIGIGNFWMDTLTRRVDSSKLVKYERFIPLIKK